MARLQVIVLIALATAACASRDRSEEPAWLADSVKEADRSARGYPRLSEFPQEGPSGRSYDEWRRGLETMSAIRDEVLSDPALVSPDDPDAEDAAAFARRSREEAARDIEAARVDD